MMAECLFWKSNGLDAKKVSWCYTSGKIGSEDVLALEPVASKRSRGSICRIKE